MRVTIEHREESAGLTGATKHHYVDCTVEFSEEERAVIKARDLYNQNFTLKAATPVPSQVAYVGSGFLNSLGRLGVLGGVIMGLLSTVTGGVLGTIAGFSIFAGACLWIYAAMQTRMQDKRINTPEQVIKLRDLLNGRVTVHASSPAEAHDIEDDIRNALASVKALLTASAELRAKQTFEL